MSVWLSRSPQSYWQSQSSKPKKVGSLPWWLQPSAAETRHNWSITKLWFEWPGQESWRPQGSGYSAMLIPRELAERGDVEGLLIQSVEAWKVAVSTWRIFALSGGITRMKTNDSSGEIILCQTEGKSFWVFHSIFKWNNNNGNNIYGAVIPSETPWYVLSIRDLTVFIRACMGQTMLQ